MSKGEAPKAPVADERYHDRARAVGHVRSKGLDITENTLIRATYYTRRLRRTKIGRHVYWAESELDRWIASCSLGGEAIR